jgi:hypothetical protein
VVANAEPEESSLDRFTAGELNDRLIAGKAVVARDAAAWSSMAFRAGARRSLIQPALIVALIMLTVEALAIGARGRRTA